MIPVATLDAAMLYAETKEMPMHTMGVLILELQDESQAAIEGRSPFEVVQQRFAERIHLIPAFRRRLVQGPLQIGDPHWIEDPSFDLDKHLVRITLPSPGTMRDLCELVGTFAASCLDRDRPLWKAALVEGLEDGKIALIMKIHHAAMDGGRAAAIASQLLDTSLEGGEDPPPGEPWIPDREPSVSWLAADTVKTLVGKPRRAAQAAARVASAVRARGRAPQAPKSDRPAPPSLFDSPPTPFNGALTSNRSVALADVAFDDVKAIKRAFGTTVNDVVLAACTASLRSWLLAHGGLPDRPLVATVPVSVRHEGEDAGNRVSVIRVHLPIQSEDPVARLMSIHEETAQRKERHNLGGGGGGDVLRNFADVVSNISVPWILTHVMSLYSSWHLADRVPPLWNLVISNIAGPPKPLYSQGALLTHLFPLGPVQQGSGLNITVMSVVDRLCFGALACADLVPDVEDLGTGFVDEIERLCSISP
ncbi:MAG: wax ester/triacylglycerol synthase family O-acyltransferase [Polyangiales bacterium]